MKVYEEYSQTARCMLSTAHPPKGWKICKWIFIACCIAAIFSLFIGFSKNGIESIGDIEYIDDVMGFLIFVEIGIMILLFGLVYYIPWKLFCKRMQQKEIDDEKRAKKAEEERAFRKANEDEFFYIECANNNILTTSKADVARFKIIAKQMDISCSDDELIQKFLKGKAIAKEKERIATEKERQARLSALRKEEQLAEKEGKKYINLFGTDKRIRMFLDEADQHRAMLAQYEKAEKIIEKGTSALYSLHAGSETDWATHGGIASAIAGSAAGVAVAVDLQNKNAEVRASNAHLRQSINQHTAGQRMNLWDQQSSAKKNIIHCEVHAENAKLKLVESLPQEDLLKLISPAIKETTTSETGTITFKVNIKEASLTIYETVKAVVDGSFKVKIMDGTKLAGEAYFTLPVNGSERNKTLTGTCASLPETQKNYTFIFAPHNLFAIEL